MPIYFWLIIGFILYSLASSIFSKKTYTQSEKKEVQKWMNLYKSEGYEVGIPDFTELKLILSNTSKNVDALIIKPDFYIVHTNEIVFPYMADLREVDRIYIDVITKKAYLPIYSSGTSIFGIKEVPLPIPF